MSEGLSSKEAEKLLEAHGPNTLPEVPPPSKFEVLIAQFKSPLVYILLFAFLVTLLLRDYADSFVIFFAVFLNTVLGYFQENRANNALLALKSMIHPTTKVVRNSYVVEIDAREIVPGDVLVLNQGDKISADGVFVEANRVFAAEALLTGESVPVEKKINDEAYMGTVVTAGTAKVLVKSTGSNTEMGKIAHDVSTFSEDTPLRRQLAVFSKQLTILVLALVGGLAIIGFITGLELQETFTIAVALAVSAIPEGLLVALTVVLAIGMQRILKEKGLVRNLLSAETLGGVTTICVDKTGTLTHGKMSVADFLGDEHDLKFQVVVANDHDDPVVMAAYEWGISEISYSKDNWKRLDSIPFSSENAFFACLNKFDESNNIIFVNGAPDVLVELCDLGPTQKNLINTYIEKKSKEGMRILGYMRKKVTIDKETINLGDIKAGFEWVGLLSFSDPVRMDVKEAFEKTKKAGIKTIVITGDYSKTAVYVMNQIGLNIGLEDILNGEDLENMPNEDLERWLKRESSVKLFARTRPQQKLKIVSLLKENGEVVAMMGDGVNDAPALANADIGIVVGDATEVAKESADLVLLDSSFSTIILAIEEGRGIFDNIRKIILYLLGDAFEEIIIVFAALIVNPFYALPIPITATQILWVNLVSDGFPNLALTIDPKNKNVLLQPPRSSDEPLISSWVKRLILVGSFTGAILAFILYIHAYKTTGNVDLARSVVFAVVGLDSLFYVFSVRTLREGIWKTSIFSNKWLLLAVLIGVVLLILPFTVPALSSLFSIVSIGNYWYWVIGASIIMFGSIEVSKMIWLKK